MFFNMKVCCVSSLESPHQGHSNDKTQYTISNLKKKITQNYPKSAARWFFSKGLKNEFETAMVNEPSVFKPLTLYCIYSAESIYSLKFWRNSTSYIVFTGQLKKKYLSEKL